MNTKTSLVPILIIVTTISLYGCNLPFGQKPAPEIPPTQDLINLATLTQQAIDHDVQETLIAPTITITPTITLTPIPPVTAGPSITPMPILPVEVKFLPGGTIAYLSARMQAGALKPFTIEAGGGQTLIASVSSEENQITLEIKDLEQGEVLVPFTDGERSVQVRLPWAGEYQITLSSPDDLDYFLSIEVPANLVVSPGMGASVVSGTINVHSSFHPDAFTRVRYLLQLQAGSVLNVSLNSQAVSGLALALIGAEDGQPYLRHEVKSSTIDNFAIPVSQAYYLDVYSIAGESTAFSLAINVE